MTKKTKQPHRKAAGSSGRALGTGSNTAQENEHAKTTSANKKVSKTVVPVCQGGKQDGVSAGGKHANNVGSNVGAASLEALAKF